MGRKEVEGCAALAMDSATGDDEGKLRGPKPALGTSPSAHRGTVQGTGAKEQGMKKADRGRQANKVDNDAQESVCRAC